jgi:hypothetical protein
MLQGAEDNHSSDGWDKLQLIAEGALRQCCRLFCVL